MKKNDDNTKQVRFFSFPRKQQISRKKYSMDIHSNIAQLYNIGILLFHQGVIHRLPKISAINIPPLGMEYTMHFYIREIGLLESVFFHYIFKNGITTDIVKESILNSIKFENEWKSHFQQNYQKK